MVGLGDTKVAIPRMNNLAIGKGKLCEPRVQEVQILRDILSNAEVSIVPLITLEHDKTCYCYYTPYTNYLYLFVNYKLLMLVISVHSSFR